jgi:hypothetical protein
MERLRREYQQACKGGHLTRRAWWDQHGAEYLATSKEDPAEDITALRAQLEALPDGPARTAFFKKNREIFTR